MQCNITATRSLLTILWPSVDVQISLIWERGTDYRAKALVLFVISLLKTTSVVILTQNKTVSNRTSMIHTSVLLKPIENLMLPSILEELDVAITANVKARTNFRSGLVSGLHHTFFHSRERVK
jgi:hypothetical protein